MLDIFYSYKYSFFKFIFNWRIIALQWCVDFFCMTTWISHKYTWVPSINILELCFKTWLSSVQYSCSVVSDSLRPHELQHARPPCPSPIPRAYPNSCPLSRWCHPAISSSVVPFSSCPSQHQNLFQWVNIVPQVSEALWMFFPLFPSMFSQWIIYTDLFWSSLTLTFCCFQYAFKPI